MSENAALVETDNGVVQVDITPETNGIPPRQFADKDRFQVARGRQAGEYGTVLTYDESEAKYAVKFDSGRVALLSWVSLKPPAEEVISLAAVTKAIVASLDEDSAAALAAELENFYPGFAEKLVNAVE